MMGMPLLEKRSAQVESLAIKTGMLLTKATPASMAQSA
jgi:hypothetical protein